MRNFCVFLCFYVVLVKEIPLNVQNQNLIVVCHYFSTANLAFYVLNFLFFYRNHTSFCIDPKLNNQPPLIKGIYQGLFFMVLGRYYLSAVTNINFANANLIIFVKKMIIGSISN